jgi:phosphatidylinositol glycan class B
MGLAAALHLLAGILSAGFYHTDEHFQILEFMMQRLGYSTAADLPIEFEHQMRPWLMPALFTGMVTAWKAVGVLSPFTWATSFRLLSAALGWLSVVGLGACADFWFEERRLRNWTLAALAMIWYFPALHARHSSENWAASLFFIGLSWIVLRLRKGPRLPTSSALAAGSLFGLAFECRYQVGFMVAGTLAWLVYSKAKARELAWIVVGVAGAIALGTLADRWGYRQWVFAPWNYVQFNLVEGHVGDVDTSPVWDFFRRAATESWPVLGVGLLAAFPIAWIRWPRHVLTWACVPFFLIHEAIGHKELRFLFPLASAGPVLAAMALQGLNLERWRWSLRGLAALNCLALAAISFIPAWMPVRFYSELYYRASDGLTLYYKDFDPFNVLGIPMTFYRPPGLSEIRLDSYEQFATRLRDRKPTADHPLWLFHNAAHLPAAAGFLEPFCHAEFRTLPATIASLPFTQRVSNWTLYRCY